MKKFTNKIKPVKEKAEEDNTLWKNDYMAILEMEGWTIVKEKDMVVTIPYLVEYNQVVLRLEDIPTFKIAYPEMESFVTCVSGSMEEGETPKQTLLREVKEETGIVVKEDFDVEFAKPLFSSKGNTAQYHICILPLYEKDYYEVIPQGDGSEHERTAKNVKIDVKYLNNINTNDLITTHLIGLIKKYINMK